jgi:hypothetical protein
MNAMIPSGSIAASSARPRAEITSQHDTAVRASCLAQRFAYRVTAVVAEGPATPYWWVIACRSTTSSSA